VSDEAEPAAGQGADELIETASRVGWLELFFDLVVVAAIALITEDIQEHVDLPGLGRFALVFGAVWLTWISVALYVNVVQQATRTVIVLLAMAAIAVMAMTSLHADGHPNRFLIAFILLAPLVIAGLAGRAGDAVLVWLLVLPVVWPIYLGLWRTRGGQQPAGGVEPGNAADPAGVV
jgi:low temperature requirement protein LtrA